MTEQKEKLEKTFLIGDWRVDPGAGFIARNDSIVRLEPKAMAVLRILAQADGEVLSRQAIMDVVWPNQDLNDDVLTGAISTLRRALGDDPKKNQFIQTLPKRGYRIVAPLKAIDATNLPGDKSQSQSKSVSKSRILIGIVTVALFFGFAIWNKFDSQDERPTKVSRDDRSIAILPLDVFSDDPEMAHFAGGLEEELIHQLAQAPDVRVIARASSAQFKDRHLSIREMGEILDVHYVMEGSVRDGPETIRITLQLIDASSDSHIWSEVFDVAGDELIAVQEQVGIAITQLMPGESKDVGIAIKNRHPVPETAYRLFLLGESHMRVGTAAAYRKASEYFADAIRISPKYALAYSRLAATYLLLYQYDSEPLAEATANARRALETAMSLEPDQPEALATMGLLYTYTKDFPEAEKYFLKALELQGNLRFALHNFGFMLWSEARFKDALTYSNQALAIDPLSGVSNYLVGDSLVGAGDIVAAQTHFEHCQQLLPEYFPCLAGLASLQLLTASVESAETTLAHTATLVPEDHFWQLIGVSSVSIHQGDFARAAELLQQAFEQNPREYALLRLQLLNSLARTQLSDHTNLIQALLAETPSDRHLRLIAALGSYYVGDCQAAIEIYESEMHHSSAFLVNNWDIGLGFSHAASLAYCYSNTGNIKARDELLKLINDYLSDDELQSYPGELFLRYKYHALIGETAAAQQNLDLLSEQNWPLLWLAAREPIQIGPARN